MIAKADYILVLKLTCSEGVKSCSKIKHLATQKLDFDPKYKCFLKVALDSQPQVIKLTSCLPIVGDSLRVLRLPPPLKLIAMI